MSGGFAGPVARVQGVLADLQRQIIDLQRAAADLQVELTTLHNAALLAAGDRPDGQYCWPEGFPEAATESLHDLMSECDTGQVVEVAWSVDLPTTFVVRLPAADEWLIEEFDTRAEAEAYLAAAERADPALRDALLAGSDPLPQPDMAAAERAAEEALKELHR